VTDLELSLLWEQYQASESLEDLDRYNALRRKMGLDLYRQPHFLRMWFYSLLHQLKPQEIGGETFHGIIKFNNIDVYVTSRLVEDPDPEETFLRIFLELKNTDCYYSVDLYPNNQIRRNRPSPSASRPFLAVSTGRSGPNNFINLTELLAYLLEEIIRCSQKYWEKVRSDLKKTMQEKSFEKYLKSALVLKKINCLKEDRKLCESVFKTEWFQDILKKHAYDIEKYFSKRHNINFDLESVWPMTIDRILDGFSISITTGYNDTVDLETDDIDEELGQDRGYVWQVAEQFEAILTQYFELDIQFAPRSVTRPELLLGLSASLFEADFEKYQWEADYEIPEFDEETGDVAYNISASREVTIPFLLFILKEFKEF